MSIIKSDSIGKKSAPPVNFFENPEAFGWRKKLFSVTQNQSPIEKRIFLNSFLENADRVYISASFSRAKISGYTDSVCGTPREVLMKANSGGSNTFFCGLNYSNVSPYKFTGFINPNFGEYEVNYYDNVRGSTTPWTVSGFVLLKDL